MYNKTQPRQETVESIHYTLNSTMRSLGNVCFTHCVGSIFKGLDGELEEATFEEVLMT